MSSAAGPPRAPEGRHHFRPPDPGALVQRPVDPDVRVSVGPRPPRPWYRQVAGQWPMFCTLLVLSAGVLVAGAGYWRRGSTIVAAGVLLAAVLRLVLPEKAAGLLVNRSRLIDVAFTTVLGAAMLAAAWVIAPGRR